jgi:hypothetical protein
MLATPMPPTSSVSAPIHDVGHADASDEQRQRSDDPEEDLDPAEDVGLELLAFDRVPGAEHAKVLGIEAVLRPHHLAHLLQHAVHQLGTDRLDDDIRQPIAAVLRLEGRDRNDPVRRVGAAVGAVLDLVDQHADHGVRRVVHEHGLAHRFFVAEQVAGDLVPEEDHAPPLLLVDRIEEPASGAGDVVAHVSVDEARSGQASVDGPLAVGVGGPPAAELPGDTLQVRDAPVEQVDVLDPRADRPTGGHAVPRARGLAGPHDGDVPSQARARQEHLAFETLAER